jgi:trk system potassium uptake protein
MKQFAVIGLGNFGYYLATQLYKKGHEVLAVDIDPVRIQEIKNGVSQAVVADATDQRAIEPLGVKEMDAAVVAVGSELNASILATLILKDIGVKRVIAKAITEAQGRILLKVGASEIIFPERDSAVLLSERLGTPNLIDCLPFMEGCSIIELTAPPKFIGKTLIELDLINRYGVQVIAVKDRITENINKVPTGSYLLKDSDLMIIFGADEGLDRLNKTVSR